MTEVLPVADIGLTDIDRAEADDPRGGVCVGTPVEGAEVRIVPLGFDPAALPDPIATGAMGEILVRAPWVSEGYHALWAVERAARPGDGWHRSGDVGHVDAQGRLWVEGRSVHVVHAASGPITPVPVERAVERALAVRRAAAVGVGPVGSQQLVVVLELPDLETEGAASGDLAERARSVVDHPVAAVLAVPALPVDIRHNAKIDRTAVAAWAAELLAGRRPRPLT
jgi:acyl-CoA synthetase (AMP-forming)/AMP-acid ligase II